MPGTNRIDGGIERGIEKKGKEFKKLWKHTQNHYPKAPLQNPRIQRLKYYIHHTSPSSIQRLEDMLVQCYQKHLRL